MAGRHSNLSFLISVPFCSQTLVRSPVYLSHNKNTFTSQNPRHRTQPYPLGISPQDTGWRRPRSRYILPRTSTCRCGTDPAHLRHGEEEVVEEVWKQEDFNFHHFHRFCGLQDYCTRHPGNVEVSDCFGTWLDTNGGEIFRIFHFSNFVKH